MFSKVGGGKFKEALKSNRWTYGTMLAFAITGLIASFTLAVDEISVLKNPDAVLSCSLNAVVNCGTVMKTPQAEAFGFPNMLIGLMGFPIVVTIALLGLSRVQFPRWFLIGAQIGYVFWTLFSYWLFFNSVYIIQVLCPWCLVVTFSMTVLMATITHLNIMNDTFHLRKSFKQRADQFLANDFDKLVTAVWIVFLIALVFAKFGDSLFA
jgi:uncharacterized membrane protein